MKAIFLNILLIAIFPLNILESIPELINGSNNSCFQLEIFCLQLQILNTISSKKLMDGYIFQT